MKKCIIILSVFSLFLFSGCKKYQVTYTYKASVSESHYTNSVDEISVNAILNSTTAYWSGEKDYTSLSMLETDAAAIVKFEASVTGILTQQSDIQKYLGDNDYFIYSLKRTTPGSEEVLQEIKFTNKGHQNL